MAFPQTRMRRLRATASLRGLVRETDLRAGSLILPMFVVESERERGADRDDARRRAADRSAMPSRRRGAPPSSASRP